MWRSIYNTGVLKEQVIVIGKNRIVKRASHTNRVKDPKIIIHKKSAVRLSKGPFSSRTPYLALCNQFREDVILQAKLSFCTYEKQYSHHQKTYPEVDRETTKEKQVRYQPPNLQTIKTDQLGTLQEFCEKKKKTSCHLEVLKHKFRNQSNVNRSK